MSRTPNQRLRRRLGRLYPVFLVAPELAPAQQEVVLLALREIVGSLLRDQEHAPSSRAAGMATSEAISHLRALVGQPEGPLDKGEPLAYTTDQGPLGANTGAFPPADHTLP